MVNNKRNWGIVALTIFVMAAGGFIYWQLSSVQPFKKEAAEAKQLEETMKQQQPIAEKNPPRPARAGYKWEWHGDHWHEMPLVPSDAPAAVKPKQPKRSKGDPLNINWKDPGYLDWTDPRTAESYRNYYGFDPPTEADYFKPVQDNFGNWIKHYRNTAVVVKWDKRIGFRPTVAQFARYKQLKTELELAQTLSLTGEPTPQTEQIEQEIRDIVASAQGEIPTLFPRDGIYYGDDTTPEQDKVIRAAADRALYERMGIGHLYEFYEVDPY